MLKQQFHAKASSYAACKYNDAEDVPSALIIINHTILIDFWVINNSVSTLCII